VSSAAFEFHAFAAALPVLVAAATVTWVLSLPLRNVSIVDSLWSLMIFAAGVIYGLGADPRAPRLAFLLWLAIIWAFRLSLFITARNMGHAEGRRHQEIRARHAPGFAWKSLYLVFWRQALFAWIVSLPLLGALSSLAPVNALDYAGIALWCVGMLLEAVADWQLARFRRDPANAGKVLERGLWRYTRHPNYFGEFCVWWGFYLVALAAGAWWALPGPLLISVLLLRVSGVTLLEKDIGTRRPPYADYVLKTNAFFPGPRRK
jgi:steroid 5-alpha reductase family enzyme